MDSFQEIVFMVFGLGFFIYVLWLVQSFEERRHKQKMKEYKLFGYPDRSRKSLKLRRR